MRGGGLVVLLDILLGIREHGRSGSRQTVGCRSITIGIGTIFFHSEEASEHAEVCTPPLAFRGFVSCQ